MDFVYSNFTFFFLIYDLQHNIYNIYTVDIIYC